MAEKISTQKTTSPRRRLSRRTIAILAAAAVVLAAGAIVSVSATNAYAAETTHQCTLALKAGSAAAHSRTTAIATADKDLAAVKSTALPGTDGWTSTKYADRPAAKAVNAECLIDRTPPPPPPAELSLAPRRDRGAGRPTKRERRDIERLRGRDVG